MIKRSVTCLPCCTMTLIELIVETILNTIYYDSCNYEDILQIYYKSIPYPIYLDNNSYCTQNTNGKIPLPFLLMVNLHDQKKLNAMIIWLINPTYECDNICFKKLYVLEKLVCAIGSNMLN